MHITLSPQRRDERTSFERNGDAIIIDGTTYDFAQLPDGATLPNDAVDCDHIVSDIERIDGKIHLTLILPHGPDAPEETRFPEPVIDPPDGPLPLPPYNVETPNVD